VRVVLFMSEEFGGAGADEYAKQAKAKGQKHVAALESDSGGFAPVGFSVQDNAQAVAKIKSWVPYLTPLHADTITEGHSGADVGQLAEQGAVALGFVPETVHYFDFHHSSLDKIEAVNRDELHQGAAAMAVLVYLIAEKGL
jgi:carboxypeptidase Q